MVCVLVLFHHAWYATVVEDDGNDGDDERVTSMMVVTMFDFLSGSPCGTPHGGRKCVRACRNGRCQEEEQEEGGGRGGEE